MLLRSFRSLPYKNMYQITNISIQKNFGKLLLPAMNFRQKNYSITTQTFTSNGQNSKPIDDWETIINQWYKKYQDFVGISHILEAQNKVTELTNELINVQLERRQLQKEVELTNKKLLDTHQLITKSELYSDDHHSLFERARNLSSSLRVCQDNFLRKEDQERDLFTYLSAAIKSCHEKERSQSEQSKYWSILLSVISASLASLITSINNWVRIKEIKEHSTRLHEQIVDKIEQLFTTDSSKPPPVSSTTKDDKYLDDVKSSIIEEISKIKVNPPPPAVISPLPAREVSYGNIATHMIVGAAIGTMITSIIYSAGDL